MEFFMVCHYIYNGYGQHDIDYVKPCSTSKIGMEFLTKIVREEDDYDWDTGPQGYLQALHRGPAEYSFDYYYLEKMVMDEEI
jgi:hypothetical protein